MIMDPNYKNRRPSCPWFSLMNSALQLFAFPHPPSSVHMTYIIIPSWWFTKFTHEKNFAKQAGVLQKCIWDHAPKTSEHDKRRICHDHKETHSLLSKYSVVQHPAQSSLAEVQQAWYTSQDCLLALHIWTIQSWSTSQSKPPTMENWSTHEFCAQLSSVLHTNTWRQIHNRTF